MVESLQFDFSSGALCLDFANTLGDRLDATADRLRTYQDVVAWARQAGILDDAATQGCQRRADDEPLLAEAVSDQALRLREAIYRIFSVLVASRAPEPGDIEVLNEGLASAMPRLRLQPADGCCRWVWTEQEDALDQVLWPVVRSAAELLTSQDIDRVRECASDECAWLFVDTSRGPRRKWCDMSTCGNRAKARRYYARHRTRPSG